MILAIPIIMAIFGLLVVAALFRMILREETGTSEMENISKFIREGANAFLKREILTISFFIVALAILMFFLLGWQIAVGFV